jgi:hypothetical protein
MYRNSTGIRVVHGASCVTGIDFHITLVTVGSEKPLQPGPGWRGKGRPEGEIGLGEEELHHNGTHWRSLLIQRKDRVPNRRVRPIRRLCAPARSVPLWWQLASDAEHWPPTSTGKFADGSVPSKPTWARRPLYRPRGNLAMFHDGLAKPMRMSTRNMW